MLMAAKAIRRQANATAKAGSGSSTEGEKKKGEKKSDVVDADFEVVDENTKKP